MVLEALAVENSHCQNQATDDFSKHHLTKSGVSVGGLENRRYHAFDVWDEVVFLRISVRYWQTHTKQEPECKCEASPKHLCNDEQDKEAEVLYVLPLLRVDSKTDGRVDVSA